MKNFTIFKGYQRRHFENLCWLKNLISEHKNEKNTKKIWAKYFADGVVCLIVFDNYKYYTGAIIHRQKGFTKSIVCPTVILDLYNKPIHWSKKGDELYLKLKTVCDAGSKGGVGLVMMDIRHFMRIVNSKDPLKTFIGLCYNGVIYNQLQSFKWFMLRLFNKISFILT